MENQIDINSILNAPWVVALLPTIVTLVITFIRKLNSPLKNYAKPCKQCGIPPLILRLSLSGGKLFEGKYFKRGEYIFTLSMAFLIFVAAGYVTYLTSKAYHESPPGWALLKLTSTNEIFLISLNEATSPDRKSWKVTPQICATQTYDTIALNTKTSTSLISKLCSAITLKSEENEIKNWITKIENGNFKLLIFSVPLLFMMYWFALALTLDAALKLTIDKYNKEQAENAKFYLT